MLIITHLQFERCHQLKWRHYEGDGVSNHWCLDCSLNRLFRRRSKKTSKLRVTVLCGGIHRWPVNSPHKGPVTRQMFQFGDTIMLSMLTWQAQVLIFILMTQTFWWHKHFDDTKSEKVSHERFNLLWHGVRGQHWFWQWLGACLANPVFKPMLHQNVLGSVD